MTPDVARGALVLAGDPERQRRRHHRPAQRQHAADRGERDVGPVAQRGQPALAGPGARGGTCGSRTAAAAWAR